jgi:hypothetical protein
MSAQVACKFCGGKTELGADACGPCARGIELRRVNFSATRARGFCRYYATALLGTKSSGCTWSRGGGFTSPSMKPSSFGTPK